MRADELIQAVLDGADPDDLCLGEDDQHVQRAKPGAYNQPRSMAAKNRFARYRPKYQAAFRKYRNSGRARLFYKKLARFNQRQILAPGDPMRGMTPFIITPKKTWGFEGQDMNARQMIDAVLQGAIPSELVTEVQFDGKLANCVNDFAAKNGCRVSQGSDYGGTPVLHFGKNNAIVLSVDARGHLDTVRGEEKIASEFRTFAAAHGCTVK